MVLLNRRNRFDLRDDMGQMVITAFGQMDLVPDPLELALSAIADVRIVRRTNPLACRHHLFGDETLNASLVAPVLLLPDLRQSLDRRELLEPCQLLCLLDA